MYVFFCNRDKWEDRQAKARLAIKEIVKCDVHKSNPLEPKVYEPFDAIVTSTCLECACPDTESYKKALMNITSLLKPGGTLILFGVLNDSFYTVGTKTFYTLNIDEEFIKAAVTETGCDVVCSRVIGNYQMDDTRISDSEGVVHLRAIKHK